MSGQNGRKKLLILTKLNLSLRGTKQPRNHVLHAMHDDEVVDGVASLPDESGQAVPHSQ